MKIPKKIKLGARIYKICFVEKVGDNADCGMTMRDTGEIKIDKSLIQSEKEVTFLHEVLHIINGGFNENEVDLLAGAIHQFLEENKLAK